jgi:hypothetical protein
MTKALAMSQSTKQVMTAALDSPICLLPPLFILLALLAVVPHRVK